MSFIPRRHDSDRRVAGFSMLEVLTVLAIVGIIATFGFPMLNSYRLATALSAAEEDLAALLVRGRWMAINAGASRVIDLSDEGRVEVEDTAGRVLASMRLNDYQVRQTPSTPSFTFGSRGFITPSATITITLTNPRGVTDTITVNSLGKIYKF